LKSVVDNTSMALDLLKLGYLIKPPYFNDCNKIIVKACCRSNNKLGKLNKYADSSALLKKVIEIEMKA
jgi:hypothetical protein